MNIDAIDWSKFPSTPHRPGIFVTMLIPDKIETLTCLYEAIGEWRTIRDLQLNNFIRAMESKRRPAYSEHGFDPIYEEETMLVAVERAMLGSLSVAIASTVETVFEELCSALHIQLSARPTWGEKKNAIENVLGIQFTTIPGFPEVTCARLLGNCIKHHGGNADGEFASAYSVPEEEPIESENYDWQHIIHCSEEFLTDLASRV
jgi:hypothetical protein